MSAATGLGQLWWACLQADMRVALRQPAELLNPLIFNVMVIALFPIGLGPNTAILQTIAPGALWVVALLACLLASESLFRSDFEDGSIEVLLLSPAPVSLALHARLMSHWLLTGLPLALVSPLLGLMLFLPVQGMVAIVLTLAVGTLVFSGIAAIAAALTVSLKRGGLLLSLLVLPLYIPVLIFGSRSVDMAIHGEAWLAPVALMGAMALMLMALAPMAMLVALRISADNS